jgi:Ran GTPase-activating protein 1
LQYNEINSEGVKAIFHAAKFGLPALKKVELNGNKFDVDHQHVVDLRELLEQRREALGKEGDDEWGLDELDELDEESEEEEESEEGEESEAESEVEAKAEKNLKEADEAENEIVAEELDETVDELGEKLRTTSI